MAAADRKAGAQRMDKVGEITGKQGGMLEITFCRPQDCGHCHACDGGAEPTVLRLRGEGQVGDYAVVSLPGSTVFKASVLAYIVPIVGLLGGMALGSALGGENSLGVAVGGAAGLALTLGAVWLTERFRRQSPRWQPTLTQVLPRSLYEKNEEDAADAKP